MARKKIESATLRRRLGPILLILYGTGVTVGAGIYVLVGPVAGYASIHAPWAFFIAAVVMGLTVASYAELCTRYPVAAGEAAYVREAFKSRLLSRFTGALMIATAVVASATVAVGASGYVAELITLPKPLVIATIIIALGAVSILGVLESVLLASLFTIIEIGGLALIVVMGLFSKVPVQDSLLAIPSGSLDNWFGIGFASLLAFFAFIGFEDLTNMVEETKNPERVLPFALGATLAITTCLYMLVAAVAVTSVPPGLLAKSPAPLSLVFQSLVATNPGIIIIIAIVATLNTILAEMTMASRVVYGMARQGDLPSRLGHVHAATSTPVGATVLVVVSTIFLTVFVPFLRLAEATSIATLMVFALVNLALIRIRLRDGPGSYFHVPIWMPIAGLLSCVAMIFSAFLQ